jgi:hypothetical protein
LSTEETAFGRAVHDYKREHRIPAPSWKEVLSVLDSLGYSLVEVETGRASQSLDERAARFTLEMKRYMRDNRRPFPAFSEVLAVARSLGYRKLAWPEDVTVQPCISA